MIPQSPQAHSVSESFSLAFDSGFLKKTYPECKVTWIGGVEGKDKSLLAPEEI